MDYVSKTQPQPPAFAAASVQVKVASKKPASAASIKAVVKPAKPAPVPTRVNAKGEALRCMVGKTSAQCSNPSRHPHGKAWTCTTHHKAILAGKKVELKGVANRVWKAPSAGAKAASA